MFPPYIPTPFTMPSSRGTDMLCPRLVVFLMLWIFAAVGGCAEDKYVQTDCKAKDDYVGIWLTLNGSGEEGVPHRSFVFDRKGTTFSVEPIYYAEEWSLIEEIIYEEKSNSSSGHLSFKLREKDGGYYIQTAGDITKECWTTIGGFLKANDIDTKLMSRKIAGK